MGTQVSVGCSPGYALNASAAQQDLVCRIDRTWGEVAPCLRGEEISSIFLSGVLEL